MGITRFRIPSAQSFEDFSDVYRAYLSGFDGRIFATRVEVDGAVVAFEKFSRESAKLNVAWPVKGMGKPVLRTTSLSEKEEPYVLPVELARGKISQIRDQFSIWSLQGFQISEDISSRDRECFRLFSQAIALGDDLLEMCRLADLAIQKACGVAELMTKAYAQHTLERLKNKTTRLPVSLGCHLGELVPSGELEEKFCETFDVAIVPVDWKNIEPNEGQCNWSRPDEQLDWCQKKQLLVHGGPLLNLSPQGLPDWLWKWEQDFRSLQSIVCDFVETAMTRYCGSIRHWEICSRVNTGGALTLTEEDRLSLVARTLEVARQVDEDLQFNIRIDQTWGEYQARGQHRLSPIQFVDALARSGLGLTGVSLELAQGFQPRGSYSYDTLEFSRLIDHWSLLNLPLTVVLAFPSGDEVDPLSNSDLEVENSSLWNSPWSEDLQAAWLDELVPLILAKDAVVRIEWAQLTDQSAHYYPNAGLIDPRGNAKQIFKKLCRYHQSYWETIPKSQEST